MKDKREKILLFLEDSFVAARIANDVEIQKRLKRAMAAFNANLEMEVFTEEFREKYFID